MISLFKKRCARRGPARRSPHAFPERLEDRTVPTTLTWTGAVGDLWSTVGNWSGGTGVEVPDSADDVLVFESGAANLTNVNDIVGLSVSQILLNDSGYTLTGNAVGLSAGLVDSAGTGTSTLSLSIGGAGGLVKIGQGTLVLDAANTYAGETVTATGVLVLTNADSLGATTGGLLLSSSNSVVELRGGFALAPEPISFGDYTTGLIFGTGGDNTVTGAVTLPDGNARVAASPGTTLTFTGVIGGTGERSLRVGDPGLDGTVVFTGTNVFLNYLSVAYGVLIAGNSGALGDTAGATSVREGATLALSGGVATGELISLEGAGFDGLGALRNLAGENTLSGEVELWAASTVRSDSGTLTVSGAVSGYVSSDLTKTGDGTLSLTGENTYTGRTYLDGGVLSVDGSIGSSAGLSFTGPATLTGTGTVPAIDDPGIGTVAPGGPAGVLRSGDVGLAAGTTFAVVINGTDVGTEYGRLKVTGDVSLGGATLDVTLNFTPSPGDVFEVISNEGTGAVGGTFNGLPEGSIFSVGGTAFRISYAAGDDGNEVRLVAVAAPTVTLTSSANPSVFGQSVTFSVLVTGGSGTPTGDVTLRVGDHDVQIVALVDGSVAFSPISGLNVGDHSVSVSYSGDNIYVAGTDQLDGGQVVERAATTTAVATSANPSAFGQAVTFTATVAAAAPGAGAPAGNVTLLIDSVQVETVALVNGSATFTPISTITAGDHTVAVNYPGDSGFAASAGTLSQRVTQSAVQTETTLIVGPAAPAHGETFTFTATVSAAGGGTVAGLVSFYDGAVLIGSAGVVDGRAFLAVPVMGAGVHTFSASYLGGGGALPSESSAVSVDVARAGTRAVFTAVQEARQGRVTGVGLWVHLVTATPGGGVPTGGVTFQVNRRPFQRPALVNGLGSVYVTAANARGRVFRVNYGGDANHQPSTSLPIFFRRGYFARPR